jgi:hypothetical protein
VLLPERNSLAFNARGWLAKSPKDFNQAICEAMRSGITSRTHDAEAYKKLTAICKAMLDNAWNSFRYDSLETINTLDHVAAAAFHISEKDLYHRADYYRHLLVCRLLINTDALDDRSVPRFMLVPRVTAEVLGKHMYENLCYVADNGRSSHIISTQEHWRVVNS